MAEIDPDAQLPPRPSATTGDLRCLGHFWRVEPRYRPHIVEFWIPEHRDLNRKLQAGAWVSGLFDGATGDDALAVCAYHFPYGCDPKVVIGAYERAGGRLVPIERGQAA